MKIESPPLPELGGRRALRVSLRDRILLTSIIALLTPMMLGLGAIAFRGQGHSELVQSRFIGSLLLGPGLALCFFVFLTRRGILVDGRGIEEPFGLLNRRPRRLAWHEIARAELAQGTELPVLQLFHAGDTPSPVLRLPLSLSPSDYDALTDFARRHAGPDAPITRALEAARPPAGKKVAPSWEFR